MTHSLIIPSDPKTKQKIKNAVEEIDVAMTHIKSQQEHIAAVCKRIQEECEIKGSIIRELGKIYHNRDLEEKRSKFEDIEAMYESILDTK